VKLAVVAAGLLGLLAGWLGFAFAGWRGGVDVVTAVLALAAIAVRSATRTRRAQRTRRSQRTRRTQLTRVWRRDVGQAALAFPGYRRLSSDLAYATSDGRYFERVVAPRLRALARDVAAHRNGAEPTDTELAARLGEPAWRLLSPSPQPRDLDEPITAAELAALLSTIEAL
jgi:hypothetical protein